jgi:hypothetical protein
MKRIRLLSISAVMLAALLTLTFAVHGEFTKLVSITGGSAQRLTDSLSAAGYTGTASVDEMTLCVPSANVNTMYLGSQSNVNASTGFPVEPGTCITFRSGQRPIDVSSFWTYVATTENAAITLRPR